MKTSRILTNLKSNRRSPRKRSNPVKTLIRATLAASVILAGSLPAFADARTEAYVQKNASEVLQSLNNPKLSAAERTATFSKYMDTITDLDAVSNFVIGKYARRFSDAELAKYRKAFRTYALAVYEYQLDAYRGEAVVVKNSVDRSETDSIVNTVIKRQDGKDMDVRWRVQGKDGDYQVIDVALNLDGNLIWLAIEQRAQFIALLDRSNGSADALIKKIDSMTAELKSKTRT
ncbi:MAG: ABC transporter substrate-binding protein [Hyphomonas sp.]|nr:ABC transporter substrate-binding protein [Hyphomonas sp.]